MTDVVWTAILGSIAPTLTVGLGFYAIYKKTDNLKEHINSKMDILLAAKFEEGKLAGKLEAAEKTVSKPPPSA